MSPPASRSGANDDRVPSPGSPPRYELVGGELLVTPSPGVAHQTMVPPDLFVVPASGVGRARSWRDVRSLLLAIEVISPSSARDGSATVEDLIWKSVPPIAFDTRYS